MNSDALLDIRKFLSPLIARLRRLADGLSWTVGVAFFSTSSAAQPESLEEAIESGSNFWAYHYMLEGANLKAVEINSESPLVHAVATLNFDMARILLQAGLPLDEDLMNRLNEIAPLGLDDPFSLGLHFLLRSHAFTQKYARDLPASESIIPNRVLIFEPTVDYSIPEIEANYYVNTIELNGAAGEDDDGNGFVDDVYGWSIVTDRAHVITPLQLQLWQEARPLLDELFPIHDRLIRGEIDINHPDLQRLKALSRNPLVTLWGHSAGYTDFDFLVKSFDVSHGSHVAGIVLDYSEGEASLHTLSWDSYQIENRTQFLVPTPLPLEKFDNYLGRFRAANFDVLVQRGYRASDYLRASGASVVNGSFSSPFELYLQEALPVFMMLAASDPAVGADPGRHLQTLAYEMYAYGSLPYVLAIAENPNILFVAAAGNDGEDIEESLASPSYLSRFFPNVITVGASDDSGQRADFSNVGFFSVNIAAPGVAVESFGVGGARVQMNGTSMAAPAVSGFAAKLRARHPELSAAQLRILLESGSSFHPSWRDFSSSGGVLDTDFTTALVAPDFDTLCATVWKLLSTAVDERVENWAWLRGQLLQSLAALTEAPSADKIQAVAILHDVTGDRRAALEAINVAIEMDASRSTFWNSKAIILQNMGRFSDILQLLEAYVDHLRAGTVSDEWLYIQAIFRQAIEAARALEALETVEKISAYLDQIRSERFSVD